MVRSKFPGKPSKIVNRRVVKATKYSVLHDNESSKAAKNISYGLAVFNETFGDHEQVSTAFHGFSPHEVDKARESASRLREKVEEEYKVSGLNFAPEDAFPVKIELPTSQVLSYVESNLSVTGPVGWHTTRAQCQSLLTEESEFSKYASPTKFFSPMKNSLEKNVANRLLQKAKKTTLDVSNPNRLFLSSQLDKNGVLNRKFVLPSRSARSARVIKPNKRFLDNESSEKADLLSVSSSHSRVIQLKKPRLIFEGKGATPVWNEGKISPTSSSSNMGPYSFSDRKEMKFTDLNVFGAPMLRPKRKSSQSQSSADGSPKKDELIHPSTSTSTQVAKSSTSLPCTVSPSKSKLILRESKLNVCSATEKLKEGLFSMKPKKGPGVKVVESPEAPTECGVCGATRLQRVTNQAMKFGLVSCEPCCKFIAKMMLRARSSGSSVPCDNGLGNCAVSSPLKGESFATKVNRCGACWLLLCVQRLVKMPEKVRDDLIRMLPANMQGMTVVLPSITIVNHVPTSRSKRRKELIVHDVTNSPKSITGLSSQSSKKLTTSTNKRLPQTPVARIKRKAAIVSLANNLRRARNEACKERSPLTPSKKSTSSAELLKKSHKLKKLNFTKKSETHLKGSEKGPRKSSFKNVVKNKDGQIQQKLSMKGPRVKHVCRSASVVLGQPLATFPVKSPSVVGSADLQMGTQDESVVSAGTSQMESQILELKQEISNNPEQMMSVTINDKENEISSLKPSSVPDPPSDPNSKIVQKTTQEPRNPQVSAPGRKITRHPNILGQKVFQRGYRRTLQDLGVYNQTEILPELISLDFWESYDPDEVCNTGFGLIGFDPFFLKPICFLCGSAGKKKLIHCASCCEPYHQFCVEMGILGGPTPGQLSDKDKDDWRVDWVCPRCTVCHGCGKNTGHQLTVCQRCYHSYHLDCLGTSTSRKSAGDRLWICSSCLRCKSCNSNDVSKFVGNLPFCKVCFKLRQKGNFCPLCQGCYTDDDYQSKMMECASCKSWVHAKCEGLSDEKYQVLSYLPESVEYICRLCCARPPAPWWLAVEAELQAGYINIIKAITKNRKAYAMLRWSPQKMCECQQKLVPPSKIMAVGSGKRRLSFNCNLQDEKDEKVANIRGPSISSSYGGAAVAREGQVASVFEFDDDIDAGENIPITRYTHAKGKNINYLGQQDLSLDCRNGFSEKPEKSVQLSPNTGSQSDSGVGSTDDELKTCSATEEEDVEERKAVVAVSHECVCTSQNLKHPFATLLAVKKKVHSSEYSSIVEFHGDMDQLISEADSHEVKELYHQTLQEVFPWFDPKYDKVSRNSFPLSPCKPHQGSLLQYQSQDVSPEKPKSSTSSFILEKLLPKVASELDDEYFYCGLKMDDARICGLCKLTGDSDACAEGRLLYCGQNEWVHVNCALWSAEVFEEIDGALQNVSNALSRGRMIRCSECGKKGASVGCCAKKCEETLHFPCARSAGFVFMEDKNAYCSLHRKDAPGKPLMKATDFDVCRPVFVELDRRKKKSIESKYVRLMIGSLLVQSLGKIVPEMSDQELSLVPTEFCCTRLFWSSKEPWRIVPYTVRTFIQSPTPEPVLDVGHHITVDHSKETCDENLKTNQSLLCNQEIPVDSKKSFYKLEEGDLNFDKDLDCKDNLINLKGPGNVKIVQSVMGHILDTVCSREADEEVTDVQNSADLLPPEVKDALFEDLPHDLLDGISMQDIFQDKFLSFEELSKDDLEDPCANRAKFEAEKSKKLMSLKAPRELKRSKSEVLPSNSSQTDGQLHQRSCSLAWKLSTTEVVVDRTKFIQELRLSVKPAAGVDLRCCLPGSGDKGKENQSLAWPRMMQVDGVSDVLLSCSGEGSDIEVAEIIPFSNQQKVNSDFTTNICEESELLCNRIECLKTVTSAARSQSSMCYQEDQSASGRFQKCKRRRISKNSVKARGILTFPSTLQIPQLDGANDLSSDSEQEGALLQETCEEKPVRCNKCGCTYRTEESHARHLPNCSGDYSLTTSESEAEISEDEAERALKSVSAPSPDSAISVSSGSLSTAPSVSPTPLPPAAIAMSGEKFSSSQERGSMVAPISTSISTAVMPIRRELNQTANRTMATVSKIQKITTTKSKSTKSSAQQQSVKLMFKGNQTVLHHQQLLNHNSQQQINQHSIQHTLPATMPQQTQMITMLDYQQSQQSTPTVLVQSVPSQSMVPAYLEAFQQHTGQNLQYLTTVDSSGGYGKAQYLAAVPSTVVPGAFQLQTLSDGQLCLEPSAVGIAALSGIQLAPTPIAQTQPQVLGTLMQNPHTLSCGAVAAPKPLYETIQVFPDQSGGVLLTSQPMLTCMETVVSNTYMSMSSSQYVSSSVPGVLQGSSTYSTTTTQVFQASKVDPPVVDVPTQYVVVNTHPSLADSAVGKLGVMAISQPQVREHAPVQSQVQIHIPPIGLPVSVTLTAAIPPQSRPPVVTSVIAPMPKVQPQRTYSKPCKVMKGCVMKKPLQQVPCSAVKDNFKSHAFQKAAMSIKVPPAPCASSNVSPNGCQPGANASALVLEKAVLLEKSDMKNPSSISGPMQLSPDSISTSTASAQSITLPDPVHSNPTVMNGTKIGAASASKCPPVTFSYRTHAIEKGKPKSKGALDSATGAAASKVELCVKPVNVEPSKQEIPFVQESHVQTQFVVTVPGSVCAVPGAPRVVTPSGLCASNKPMSGPILTPHSVQISINPDAKRIESLNVVSPAGTSTNAAASSIKCDTVEVPVSSISTSLSAVSTSSVPTVVSTQSQIGKNVSLSSVTASLAGSLTNAVPKVSPIIPSKLPNTGFVGLKPLKEINQASMKTDFRAAPSKVEKIATSVSPTILKSSSQNFDYLKKNNAILHSQNDIPIMFTSEDNSSASLKLLFQKQAHNGCYKVSSSPGKKDCELKAMKFADINIITGGHKKVGKDESENVKPEEKVTNKINTPEIMYEIHCQDGFSYSSSSISDAWQKVFGAVQEARANHKMPPLIHNPFSSIESAHSVMGLGNNSLKYLLEQLPGLSDCRKYRPIYHKSRLPGPGYQFKREDHDIMTRESHSGCARTDPYLSAKRYDMFSWLDSRHRPPPKLLDNSDIDSSTGGRRTASITLPMAMRYRHLKETSKTSVGVFRSDIHGRGLFCLRDIEGGEMVIEYAGEVIRNTLTDNREKYYQSKGIGCYMFKVDDNFTVDATQKGNAARFINHSCEPNCHSKVVDVLGKKHIIIFALRRIPQGEELTYDYKFPIEDEKIHCHCLARRCRKYLN